MHIGSFSDNEYCIGLMHIGSFSDNEYCISLMHIRSFSDNEYCIGLCILGVFQIMSIAYVYAYWEFFR